MKQKLVSHSELEVKDKSEMGQLIKVSLFETEVRKTNPHKHNNYFEIIYLVKGKGKHFIDGFEYAIEPPIIFLVRREQVHHWDLKTIPEGFVLILKKAFMDRSYDDELKVIFATLSNISNIRLKENQTINSLFQLLLDEYDVFPNPNRAVLEGLLKALLAKILQAKPSTEKTLKARGSIFHQFREFLSVSKDIRNSVAYYANRLNTSPQNLNSICQIAVKQSASLFLAGYVISEAKRLILYTDKTITEISQILHFKDPSHFVKYFKKFAGTTPQSIRKGE